MQQEAKAGGIFLVCVQSVYTAWLHEHGQHSSQLDVLLLQDKKAANALQTEMSVDTNQDGMSSCVAVMALFHCHPQHSALTICIVAGQEGSQSFADRDEGC